MLFAVACLSQTACPTWYRTASGDGLLRINDDRPLYKARARHPASGPAVGAPVEDSQLAWAADQSLWVWERNGAAVSAGGGACPANANLTASSHTMAACDAQYVVNTTRLTSDGFKTQWNDGRTAVLTMRDGRWCLGDDCPAYPDYATCPDTVISGLQQPEPPPPPTATPATPCETVHSDVLVGLVALLLAVEAAGLAVSSRAKAKAL